MNTHDLLEVLVKHATCKPGWTFALKDYATAGVRLVITVEGLDSRANGEHPLTINHFFPVPEATYNVKSWRRWIFECCRKVEDHELGEWFLIDGLRPFAPCHAPGENPYDVHEFRDETDARTDQRGEVT